MKTDQEIRKMAKADYDKFHVSQSAISWSSWKQAYSIAYRRGWNANTDNRANQKTEES